MVIMIGQRADLVASMVGMIGMRTDMVGQANTYFSGGHY